jgi:beta-mannosidase
MKSPLLSKRKFLATTATAAAAVCAWKPSIAFGLAPAPNRSRLNLNGAWKVAREGEKSWLSATVPGCIHTDLLNADRIPDPFFRDNEDKLQWIGESNWTYRRTFSVPREILQRDQVLLHCDGLDTLAVIKINGREIGRADNMFRIWEFDAKSFLQAGDNTIEISFTSPLPYMKECQAKRTIYEWAGTHEPHGRAWVRKEPCNFGWDWGPVLITCGIWRNIYLDAFNVAAIDAVSILQDHADPGRVGLQVEVKTRSTRATPLNAVVMVNDKDRTVESAKFPLSDGSGICTLTLANPKLWWPAGMGEPALYGVTVDLLDADGKLLDRAYRNIGLRTLKLREQDGDNPMRFEVNGVPFFSKGANWIPADAFANRVTPEILRRYVSDAVAANMNTLRFWGGGYYEEDALFDACDEMGICVWLDFKFACSSYPAFDENFMENVRREARDHLRRLRHHPCIATWCGNNEIGLMVKDNWSRNSMGRADYDKLFKDLLAREVRDTAPQANYVSGSPDCGDVHFWGVWHGGKTFDAYRTLNGFLSEFGFQSFPEPRTIRACTNKDDRASVTTPVMQWHQRSPRGNEKILEMIGHYFRPPKDFDSTLWLSQILQGFGIKLGAEFWRQNMATSTGCVYWQYNDCWPAISWSSVDYFGRWKALHYMARRFYSPLLVSGLEDAKNQSLDMFVSSDRLEPCAGTLSWTVTNAEGRLLTHGSHSLEISPRKSQKAKTLDLREFVQTEGAGNILVWLELVEGSKVVSTNLVTLGLPKDIRLADPKLKTEVASKGGEFVVTLTSQKPALWTWLLLEDTDARYSDNFVHVTADKPVRITVKPAKSLSKSRFVRDLRIRSLFDTYTAV